MAFYTNPTATLRFTGSCNVAAAFSVHSAVAAPIISVCIVSMEPYGLMFNPPQSNVTPLPTRLIASLLCLLPVYYNTNTYGSCADPLPTLYNKLSPAARMASPRSSLTSLIAPSFVPKPRISSCWLHCA